MQKPQKEREGAHGYWCSRASFSVSGGTRVPACFYTVANMPPQLHNGLDFSAKVIQGSLDSLPQAVRKFVEGNAQLCQPEYIHICDGSEEEYGQLLAHMQEEGVIRKLKKYDNW